MLAALAIAHVASCRATHPEPEPKPTDVTTIDVAPVPDPYSVSDSRTLVVRLQRSPCGWGECPQYTLTISGDGTVTFVGALNVTTYGEAHGQLDADAMGRLADAFRSADFLGLSVDEKRIVYDAARLSITYEHDGISRTVGTSYAIATMLEPVLPPAQRGLHDGEIAVDALSREIDTLCRVEQWVGFRP